MKIKLTASSGFTLVEIMIVVAIIGMLASIAIPSYVRARDNAQQKTCINNLRQIDGAAQTWAIENKRASTDTYQLTDLKPYMKLTTGGEIPPCPSNGTYSSGGAVTNPPLCSLAGLGHALP